LLTATCAPLARVAVVQCLVAICKDVHLRALVERLAQLLLPRVCGTRSKVRRAADSRIASLCVMNTDRRKRTRDSIVYSVILVGMR
jgi:hypothetical protein